jgi:GNAT superfamily N-acetyltransferase
MNATMDSTLIIRPIEPTDSIADLTDLLHRAYARLAAMGLRFYATYQTEEQTRERLDDAECFVGVMDDRIVATIAYYGPARSKGCDWYKRPDVAYFGQFAVEPDLQRRGIGERLIDTVERRALADGAAELALDTAEPAEHLIRYYTRLGYRLVDHVQWDLANYRSVIMSKTLGESVKGEV